MAVPENGDYTHNQENIGPFFDTTIDLEVPYQTNPDFEYFPFNYHIFIRF